MTRLDQDLADHEQAVRDVRDALREGAFILITFIVFGFGCWMWV